MSRNRVRFKTTKHGIRPEPIGAYVWCAGLGYGREFLGEVTDTFYTQDGTRLRVKHFNGEPWPFTPLLSHVDVVDQELEDDNTEPDPRD